MWCNASTRKRNNSIITGNTRSQNNEGLGAKTIQTLNIQTDAEISDNVIGNDVANDENEFLDVDNVKSISNDCLNANNIAFAIEKHKDLSLNNAVEVSILAEFGRAT